jgi:transcriptional regulator with XRE-family HTH domain
MSQFAVKVAENLKRSRLSAGISQFALAQAAKLKQSKVSRFESGQNLPDLKDAVKLAVALKIPIERLLSGRWRPHTDLRGIALELYQLGVCDLEIASPRALGAFRRNEQVLAIVLQGDRPDPRIVEALPLVLSIREFNVPLAIAFADLYDARIRHRLAWLSELTLFFSKQTSWFPVDLRSERQLNQLIHGATKPKQSDSLGHPASKLSSPIWARWNIHYGGTIQSFKSRIEEVWTAYQRAHILEDPGE